MAAARAISRPATLKRREFFEEVTDRVREGLPAERQSFNARHTMNLLKIHYGANFRIHYEAWINTDTGFIELGLHFEDGPASTSKLLDHFDQHIIEIKHELGTHCELERWTRTWGHLYETLPIRPLTDDLVAEVADRLTSMIQVLQPLLDEAYATGLAPTTPRPSTFRRRFRGRR